MSRIFYVCSYGGSGSKVLCTFLNRFGKAFHLHSRHPPQNLQGICGEDFNGIELEKQIRDRVTVIFLFRNPTEAQLSRWGRKHFKHIHVPEWWNISDDRKTYIEKGIDRLKYEEFFDNYIHPKQPRNYKILTINYHNLWTDTKNILTELNLPTNSLFPPKIETGSIHRDITLRPSLNKLNKSLIEKIERMPTAMWV